MGRRVSHFLGILTHLRGRCRRPALGCLRNTRISRLPRNNNSNARDSNVYYLAEDEERGGEHDVLIASNFGEANDDSL